MIVGDQHTRFHVCAAAPARALVRACLLILAMVMTLPHAPARAAERDPLALSGPANVEALSRHFEYITDHEWQLSCADFVDPSDASMTKMPGPVPDFGYTQARIWLRLDVRNETAETRNWLFYFHANFTQQIAVYRLGSDGAVATLLDLTEDTPFGARPVNFPQMVAPFDLGPGETATLVVAYYSQGASRLSMSIETPDSFAAIARVSEAKNYAFYGMMLVMIALAGIALAVLHQPVFAAYAGYLIFVLMYVAHAVGTAFQNVWPGFPRFNSMASVVAGSSAMVCGGRFAGTLLQTGRYHAIMQKVLLRGGGLVESVS